MKDTQLWPYCKRGRRSSQHKFLTQTLSSSLMHPLQNLGTASSQLHFKKKKMGHFVASLSLSASQERIQQCGNSDHGGSSNTSGAKPAFRGKSQKHATPNFQREPYVWASKAKHRAAVPFAPPEKLTSCVFPRPMTLITTHPGNEVRDGPCKVKLEKSQQLCASWRLETSSTKAPKQNS